MVEVVFQLDQASGSDIKKIWGAFQVETRSRHPTDHRSMGKPARHGPVIRKDAPGRCSFQKPRYGIDISGRHDVM